MKFFNRVLLSVSVVASTLSPLLVTTTAQAETAAERYYRVNSVVNQKLRIPFWFTIPENRYLKLDSATTNNNLVFLFRHNDSYTFRPTVSPQPNPAPQIPEAVNPTGLRLVVVKKEESRATSSARLAGSGLVKTGDIILSYRKEWSGTGAYPHVQLGVSHAALALVENGQLFNVDMPLDQDYMGNDGKSTLSSKHYAEADMLHIVRPKNLTDAERANVAKWLKLFITGAKRIYPAQLSFNKDYQSPKYDGTMSFVQELGRMALGIQTTPTNVYCSEFAWAVLSLRDCDPVADKESFQGSAIPSCIKPIFKPLSLVGSNLYEQKDDSTIGMTDGSMIILNSLQLPAEQKTQMINFIFDMRSENGTHLSAGHQAVVNAVPPQLFTALGQFWTMSFQNPTVAAAAAQQLNASQRPNYSPTAYVVHTLLPDSNKNKAFDYVATIAYVPNKDFQAIVRSMQR